MKRSRRKAPRKQTYQPGNEIAFQPRNARELAFRILDKHFRTDEFASRILEQLRQSTTLDEREIRLSMEMVYTVIRRQSTLNAVLEQYVARARHQVEGQLWTLLQLGVTQLIFLDSIPRHAAIHETVEVAKRLGRRGWPGFLNGVLRALNRDLTDETTDAAASNAVPLVQNRFRVLKRDVFPDPSADVVSWFSRAFSFPQWLAVRWSDRLQPAELFQMGFWFNAPPSLTLRINLLKTTRENSLQLLTENKITAHAGQHSAAVILNQTTDVTRLPGFSEGLFSVQDESAMNVADLLDPQPGETVLDMCAAPGTKTTHLAERMQNQGRILATDIKQKRLRHVRENAERFGLGIIHPVLIQPGLMPTDANTFDAALVDAPCSNTGVLGKRPEARWRLHERELPELAALQKQLLNSACDSVRPGGRVVYSTCSIEPDENSEVVRNILEKRSDMSLVRECEFSPGNPFDGGYQALLQRS
ncbi:MAG: 16S rRNA (cytosine(967)-C(5))-methyltransferase RsmB [Planctomycetaceae bacterium]